VLAILKTRESGHDPSLRELIIDDEGLHIGPRFDSTAAVLTDTSMSPAQRREPKAPRSAGARKKPGGRK
jgi:circadian clock protein KaiC